MLSAVVALALFVFNGQHPIKEPIRLKPYDVIDVVVDLPRIEQSLPLYGGQYIVMDDGSVYGAGFGRLVVEGMTVEEAQKAMRKALSPYVKPNFVFLSIRTAQQERFYVIGESISGPIPYDRPLTVREALAFTAPGNQVRQDRAADADLLTVEVVRGGKRLGDAPFLDVLQGTSDLANMQVQPEDVVAVLPQASIRVWVTGLVGQPGSLRIADGATASEAIAAAGGVRAPESELTVYIRRGPETQSFSFLSLQAKDDRLESGDVVTVQGLETVRVTVGGQVARPGELIVPKGTALEAVIAQAGGPTPEGSLSSVTIYRAGEVLQFDLSSLSKGLPVPAPETLAGDQIFVQRNQQAIYVFGEVAKPGRYLMPEDRPLRLADALALGGGLSNRGTLRRVFVGTPGPDGHYKISSYNLDEFLKDGRMEANPELKSGDAILFGQPAGITLGTVTQAISSFVFLQNLVNNSNLKS